MSDIDLSQKTELDTHDILTLLPHRYPMLLVDRLKYVSEDKLSAIGYKGITMNEPCFQGHFPENPIFPGVLQIEAMAQAGGLMIMGSHAHIQFEALYLVKMEDARFRSPVFPGCMLELHVQAIQARGLTVKFAAQGVVDGKTVSQATLLAAGVPKPGQDLDMPTIKPVR